MGFQFLLKSMTLNDLERRNGSYLWSPYVIGQTIIFSSCFFFFFFLLSSFFSSPNLSGRKLDVYHTLAHDVALVRIQNAGLKCAARGSLQIQDAKKSSSRQNRTTLSDHIFATKACIDNRKKNLLSSNTSSTCLHNMVNFGLLAAEILSGVWGIPATFNGFRVFAALLHGSQVVSVSQILRHETEGATYVRQGDHHVGPWPTFLVLRYFT